MTETALKEMTIVKLKEICKNFNIRHGKKRDIIFKFDREKEI